MVSRRVFVGALVAAVISAASACADVFEPDEEEVFVRLRNATSATLTEISLSWPNVVPLEVAQLAPGATTEYQWRPGAYRYGRLSLKLDGASVLLQPIDYVGESPLKTGRYTFVIQRTAGAPQVTLELLKDG